MIKKYLLYLTLLALPPCNLQARKIKAQINLPTDTMTAETNVQAVQNSTPIKKSLEFKPITKSQPNIPTLQKSKAKIAVAQPKGVLTIAKKIKDISPEPKSISVPTAAAQKTDTPSQEKSLPFNTPANQVVPTSNTTPVTESAGDELEEFFAVFPNPSQPSHKLLPSLEKTVNAVYQDALHIPAPTLDFIKKFYCFLQEQVFDEKLQKQQIYLTELQSKIDIATIKQDPLLSSLQAAFTKATADYEKQKLALDGSILELCRTCSFWQAHIKSFVASSFDYEYSLLSTVHKDEKQIFSILPQFEIAYYTQDFTSLRINSELVRIFLILLEIVRERLIAESTSWSTIADQSELYDAIATFKTSPEYLTQKTFIDAVFSQKTYPLPNPIVMTTPTGSITAGFKDFLQATIDSENKVIISPIAKVKNMIQVDPATNKLSLTSMGNLFLIYTPATATSEATFTYTPLFHQLFQTTATGHMPTKLYLTLLGFSAIKLINGSLEYLFNTANLESTMAQFATIDDKIIQDFPIIIPYQASDYLYLDDINFLKAGSSTLDAATGEQNASTTKTASAQGIFGKIGKAFSKAGKSFGNIIVSNAKSIGNAVEDGGVTFADNIASNAKDFGSSLKTIGENVGEGISDILISKAYYDTGIACLTEGITYTDAQKKSAQLVANSMNNINDSFDKGYSIIDTLGKIGQSTAHFAATLGVNVGTIAFLANPALAGVSAFVLLSGQKFRDQVTNFLKSSVDLVKSVVVAGAKIGYTALTTQAQLTTEALMFAAHAIVQLVTAPFIAAAGHVPLAGIDIVAAQFAKDLVVSLLRPLKFAIAGFGDTMHNLMLATAYLAGAIIDATINISGSVAALAATTYGGDPSAAFQTVKNSVNQHRRVITSAISIVIMVAASIAFTVATGGAATPAMLSVTVSINVLMAGMTAMSTQGEHERDLDTIKNKSEQKEFLQKFNQYVKDSELSSQATQNLVQTDISLQYEDILKNQERSILYYQNYLNTCINASISSAAYGLGSFYNQLLTPNAVSGLPYADPGQVYGIQTNRLNLNPAQGLITYNLQRNTFAQEIAVIPEQTITDQQGASLDVNTELTKFWINQKDISTISNGPLAAEIRFRTLYESNGAFYVGLFLSNQYIDKNAINAIYKNFSEAQALTGAQSEILKQQAWKNLDAVNRQLLNFNNKGKALVIYKDSIEAQPMLGLYEHSGAGWITKNIAPITYQTGVWQRMKIKVEQNKISVKYWQEHNPEPIGWQGTYPISFDAQYIYPSPINLSAIEAKKTTSNSDIISYSHENKQIFNQATGVWTNTTPIVPKTVTIPATGSMGVIASGAAVEYQVLTPAQTIALTTARTQSNTTIDQTFAKQDIEKYEVDRAKKAILKKEEPITAVTFGSFTLVPVHGDLLNQGIYLYTTQETELGNSTADYVTPALSVTANKNGTTSINGLGIKANQSPQAIISLITGKAYDQNKKVLQNCPNVFETYTASFAVDQDTLGKITNAITSYYASSMTPIVLGTHTFTPQAGAIYNNSFIYSVPSFTPKLTSLDYFVAANVTTTGDLTSAQSYGQKLTSTDTTITGMISLITGQVFGFATNNISSKNLLNQDLKKVTLVPIKNAPSYTNILLNYSSLINSNLYADLQKQSAAYSSASFIQSTTKQTTTTATPVVPPVTISISSLQIPETINDSANTNFNDDFGYNSVGL